MSLTREEFESIIKNMDDEKWYCESPSCCGIPRENVKTILEDYLECDAQTVQDYDKCSQKFITTDLIAINIPKLMTDDEIKEYISKSKINPSIQINKPDKLTVERVKGMIDKTIKNEQQNVKEERDYVIIENIKYGIATLKDLLKEIRETENESN